MLMDTRLFNISQEKKQGVISLLIQELQGRKEVVFSYLHGSFHEGSGFRDIDVAVFVKTEGVPKEKALEYELTLSVELGYRIGLPVDIKILNYAPLGFQYHATKGRLFIDHNGEKRIEFLTTVWNKYLDYAPKSREFLMEMLP